MSNSKQQKQSILKWKKKIKHPTEHKNYPIRYSVGDGWIYAQSFYNKDFGWQSHDIFDFEWLLEEEKEQEEKTFTLDEIIQCGNDCYNRKINDKSLGRFFRIEDYFKEKFAITINLKS